ncbi:MAG: cbb3-type cytochrome oxidase assembly protein CcoS [Myxococcales bacterium]|jgi:cbb3-type cytochrome oxidase maturation protein|nr:cbb3-type cytochrome oxidase assembly protein CcoS [Myxococcales bacterium]
MSALFVVLPLAVMISALAVGAFVWATRRGQLDDLDTPALRMLHDDAPSTARPGPPSRRGHAGPSAVRPR